MPASSFAGRQAYPPSLDYSATAAFTRRQLDAIGVAAEDLLRLRKAERPQRERSIVWQLYCRTRDLDLGDHISADAHAARGNLQRVLEDVLDDRKPLAEFQYLMIIRLLVLMGSW